MQNKQTLSKPLVVMLLAGLCCLLWGSAIPFINLGYRYFGVSAGDTATQILFGGCRFFLAGFLTILFESVARKSPAFPKRTSWGNVVKLSLAQTIIQYVFFYIGVAHTASAKGAIIQGLQAFTSILIACFIFRTERMNALKWIGGLIGVAGVVVVNWTKDGFGGGVRLIGEGFVIISMVASACSTGLIKKFGQFDSPVVMSGWQFMLGGGVFALGGAAAGESGFPRGGLYVPAADFRRDSVAAAGGSKQRRAASALCGGAGDDLREHRGGQPRAAAGGGKNFGIGVKRKGLTWRRQYDTITELSRKDA